MIDDDYTDSTVEVTVSRDMSSLLGSANSENALLLVLSGARIGLRVVLGETVVSIGRGSTSGFVLDVDSVSRHHAVVEWDGKHHRLVDKGSTNGTFVNHQRIQDRVLHDGDHIQIGKALLKYVASGNIEASYHQEFAHLMHHDGLTGARTKASFEEAFRDVITTKGENPSVALVVFDLDHFKAVNDTYGHTAGDAVLQQSCNVVRRVIGDEHLFGRVGGEEFAILLQGASLEEASGLAEHVRAALQAADVAFENRSIPVTASFGVAEHEKGSDESPEDFYRRADQLLYVAKHAGRNRVCA